jgi:hypothetical protein
MSFQPIFKGPEEGRRIFKGRYVPRCRDHHRLALFDFCRSFGERLGWGAFVFLSTNDKRTDNSKGIIALDPREHNP